MTGAEVIVAALRDAGVQVVFGLPGVHNLALWEALRESEIRLVGVRHEQAAAYAADGYARATGRLGVALTTTGPGAANTLGAVGEAWASRSPVLVVATDIPSTLRRPGVHRGVLHETEGQAAMFEPVVKARFHGAEEIGAAIAAATTAPARPVYLEIPTDLLHAPAPAADRGWREPLRTREHRANPPEYRAQRPLVWAGGGARDMAPLVVALAERLGAPVLETYTGRGIMPLGHPLRVGLPPHVPAAGALWDQADLVVTVGSDLDGMMTQNWSQPQPPAVWSINVDPADAAKNYRVDAHVGFDLPGPDGPPVPWADLDAVRSAGRADLDPRALRFLDAFERAVPADANVVCDMCIAGYWLSGFHPFPEPRRLAYPMGWGTLGFGFPAAMGTSLAGTGPTVAVCGDGGFLFATGELATIAQERLPLTTVIVDDGGYGMLRYDQDQAGEARYGVDLVSPDFAAVATAFGIRAQTVEDLDEGFGAALAEHVADPEPSVLVARAPALTPPPTTSPRWYRRRR